MDFPFPPAPPAYAIVTLARVALVVWSLTAVGILAFRLRNWKSIQNNEIVRWWLAAGISYLALFFATSRTVYDNNEWLVPIMAAALGVSVAGITLGLSKIYVEETTSKRRDWIVSNLIAAALLIFVVIPNPRSHPPEAYRRTACKNNLKSIGLAMHNYHDDQMRFTRASSGSPLVSWRVTLLPYLDQRPIYHRYHPGSEWNSADNLPLASEKMNVFSCPSSYYPRNSDGLWYTAYSMPIGEHTVGGDRQGTSFKEITDGTSSTLLIVEACGSQIIWTEPRDVNIDSQPAGINLKGSHPGDSAGWLSSYHGHGTFVLLADGSVRFLSQTIDAAILKKLATIDGGEQVDDF